MTTTLSSLTTRVQAALMDSGAAVWDAGTVTEGIRLAVGEYGLAGKAAVTVSGLDGAGETTLPALHDSLIVWGAAGYAAQARSIDRAESFEIGSEAVDLKAWGDQRLKEFRGMLGFVFPGYLVVASSSSSGEDPAKVAAEVALLGAQADLTAAQTAAATGQESRAAAAATLAAADRAAEAARLAGLRSSTAGKPAGTWANDVEVDYPEDYSRS